MKTRHVDCPRSAIIVFRFSTFNFGEVSHEASYADSRTLHGLGCPSRASPAPVLRRQECRHPSVEKPAAFGTATGIGLSIYFRFVPFNSAPSEIQFSIFNPGTFRRSPAAWTEHWTSDQSPNPPPADGHRQSYRTNQKRTSCS